MRKVGFYPRLAIRSLRLNGKFYLPYLLSGIVSAAMLYDILFLNMNRGIYQMKGVNAVQGLLGFGAMVVAIFSFALLCYTNGFLMKRRQKELGLYNILGMEKRHMARLLFWETVCSALICVAGGLVLGVLLSKLFLLLLCAVVGMEVPFGFEVPAAAVVYTVAAFGGIFLLNYLLNILRLNKVKPIELLKGTESGEREPRTKWLLAVFGLLTMGAGYGISLTVSDPVTAMVLFFLAVILVIVGTYCLFTAGSIALLKALRKNKTYYYRTRHFTAVSGMLHRMKRNAAGLATICILSTMVLITVSTTLCLYMGVNEILDRMYCRDVQTYVNHGAPEDLPKVKALYERKAAELGVKMEDSAALCFYAPATKYANNRTDIDLYLEQADGADPVGDPADGPMRVYVGCNLPEDADTSLFAASVAVGTSQLELSSSWSFTDDCRAGDLRGLRGRPQLRHHAAGGHDPGGGEKLHPEPDLPGVLPAPCRRRLPHRRGLPHDEEDHAALRPHQHRPLPPVQPGDLPALCSGLLRHLPADGPGVLSDRQTVKKPLHFQLSL